MTNKFSEMIANLLRMKKLKAVDIVRKSNGRVKNSMVHWVVSQGNIPSSTTIIDGFAKALGGDPFEFRKVAAKALCDALLEKGEFGVTFDDLCGDSRKKTKQSRMPVFNLSQIADIYDKNGKVVHEKAAKFIDPKMDLGDMAESSYMICADSGLLMPRVNVDEYAVTVPIAVLEKDRQIYGIIKDRSKNLHIGHIKHWDRGIMITTYRPLENPEVTLLRPSDIFFYHECVWVGGSILAK